MSQEESKLRISIVGDGRTGKTTWTNLQIDYVPKTPPLETIGCGLYELHKLYDREDVHFFIWDTSGDIRYRSLNFLYYKKSDLIIITIDLSIPFDQTRQLDAFVNPIENEFNGEKKYVVIGMKKDIEIKDVSNQIKQWCQINNILYFENSSIELSQQVSIIQILHETDIIILKRYKQTREEMLIDIDEKRNEMFRTKNQKDKSKCIIN